MGAKGTGIIESILSTTNERSHWRRQRPTKFEAAGVPLFVVLVVIAIVFIRLCLVNVRLPTRLEGGGAGGGGAPSLHSSSLRYSDATGGKNAPAAARDHDVNNDCVLAHF